MISVIIIVHNAEKYLHVCINSVLKQTYSDLEIICIDDASTDSSKEILKYFSLKDSRIKIFSNEIRKGEYFCKIKGLEIANGKYVSFLRVNGWISFTTFKVLTQHMEEKNLDLIFYNNNNLNIKEFEVFNPLDFDETTIDILNTEWDKFYLKSIINGEDFIKIFNSTKRISLINRFFRGPQKLKKDGVFNEILIKQHLTQVNQVNNLELSIKKQEKQINEFIQSQKEFNDRFLKSSKIFVENYKEFRKYFFNNQEDKLKKYFNTNELFRLCYFNNFKFLSYSPAENRILIKTDEGIILGSNNRFYTIKEVIGFNGYSIPQLYDFDEFIVFDVGMNRSYASLWFANFDNCKLVYGFEIDSETYDKALSNINLNPHLSNKIKLYNFGLSNEDAEVDLYYVNGCDGVNTMISEVAKIQPELQDKNKLNTKKVQVKKASKILSKIIENENITSKIVLKIDTEGAEYNIINDLIDSKVISNIDVLLGEGHLFETTHFCDKLIELGFKQVELQMNKFTYNFAFVKNEHFNIWALKK